MFLSELRSFAMLKGWSGTNGDAIVRRGVYVNLGMLFSKRSIISMAACSCCGLDMTVIGEFCRFSENELKLMKELRM